jgi:hypothetical protein
VDEKPAEQGGVLSWRDWQDEIGIFSRRRATWIDHHQLRAARMFVGDHALIENRMTPGRIRADEHDHIGKIEIRIAAGDGVAAEGAAMAGDR